MRGKTYGHQKNIEEWERAGGTGILFTSAEQVIDRILNLEEMI